jgi:hypothetical protein
MAKPPSRPSRSHRSSGWPATAKPGSCDREAFASTCRTSRGLECPPGRSPRPRRACRGRFAPEAEEDIPLEVEEGGLDALDAEDSLDLGIALGDRGPLTGSMRAPDVRFRPRSRSRPGATPEPPGREGQTRGAKTSADRRHRTTAAAGAGAGTRAPAASRPRRSRPLSKGEAPVAAAPLPACRRPAAFDEVGSHVAGSRTTPWTLRETAALSTSGDPREDAELGLIRKRWTRSPAARARDRRRADDLGLESSRLPRFRSTRR